MLFSASPNKFAFFPQIHATVFLHILGGGGVGQRCKFLPEHIE